MVGDRERNKRGCQIGLGIEHPVEYRLNSEASCPQSRLRSSRLPLFVKPQGQSAHTTADVGILAENMPLDGYRCYSKVREQVVKTLEYRE